MKINKIMVILATLSLGACGISTQGAVVNAAVEHCKDKQGISYIRSYLSEANGILVVCNDLSVAYHLGAIAKRSN